jgi:AcrR family transcriptional regulator
LKNTRDNRPPRADAARNRARVLNAARELFADRGTEVPLDEIARRAGVGPGTVHLHFPTKAALLAAIIVERIDQRAIEGSALADSGDPEALFEFLERLLDDGRENLAVKAALSESGFDLRHSARDTVERLDEAFCRLLHVAQRSGSASKQLDVEDVKATLVAALAAQEYLGGRPDRIARAREVVLRGLRPDALA